MARMTGGKAIVKSLRQHDIDTIFCVPGVQLDHLFNALYDEGNSVRVLHNRHEQGSAYMAFGYAASTGKVGTCVCVPGSGLLNMTGALSTAYSTNAPVLALTGQIPSGQIDRGLGAHHEIVDQLGTFRHVAKWAARIEHPADAPRQVEAAFREMFTGRIRPVGLEMAPDVMASEAEVTLRDPLPRPVAPAPDPDAVEAAAKLLGAAERPLILAGGGSLGAREALVAVAEMLQAPVSPSRNGKGTIDARHALAVPEAIGHRLWADADAVLAVGTRMYEQYYGWGVDSTIRIVRIDIDPTEIARSGKPAVGIVGDARAVLAALADRLDRHNRKRGTRREELDPLRAETQKSFAALSPQYDFINVIREELPEDGFVVSESTQMAYVARIAMPFYHPRSFVSPGYQGTLGYGFATSLGVKVANPDRAVVSISGDGGFMYNVQELSTAVQQNIGVVALVFNDGAFGNVRRTQVHKYGNRVIATDLHNPDFVKLAESFGAQGLRATSPDELRAALKRGLRHSGPTLIEIPVGELPSPWHLMHFPRVRPKGAATPVH
jgi:acetolactate synthase-1/2/3 large subunit